MTWWRRKKEPEPRRALNKIPPPGPAPVPSTAAAGIISAALEYGERNALRPGGYSIGTNPMPNGDIMVRINFPAPQDSHFVTLSPEMFDEWMMSCQLMRDEMRADASRVKK